MRSMIQFVASLLVFGAWISFAHGQTHCKACSNPNLGGGGGSLGRKNLRDHQLQLTLQFDLGLSKTRKAGTSFVENLRKEQALITFTSLNAVYMFAKGVSFGAGLPFGALFTQSQNGGTFESGDVVGLGDLNLAFYYALDTLFGKRAWIPKIRAGLGLSLPTGKAAKVVDGTAFNGLSVGRGNVNLLANLFVLFPVHARVSLFLVGSLLNPLSESPGITFGATLLYGGGLSWQFWPGRMGAQISVEAEHFGKSRDKSAGTLFNSGGFQLSAVAALTFDIVKGLQFAVRARVPFYQYVEGEQLVPNFSITSGLSFAFPSFF